MLKWSHAGRAKTGAMLDKLKPARCRSRRKHGDTAKMWNNVGVLDEGTLIDGKYEVRRAIGSGGMGVVYEVHHANMDRLLALKLVTYAPSDDEENIRRFEREAKILSRLSHPNIVQFFSYGLWTVYPYIAMELLTGTSLAKKIAQAEASGQALDARSILQIAVQICDALNHAHSDGIFHRDIKPSNILIAEDGRIKLIDFGLAKLTGVDGHQKLTQTGMALGSVIYMSPEQVLGHKVDARSDIYSLGCVLYECFTGESPFTADTGIGIMFLHLNEKIGQAKRWKEVPTGVQQVIAKCLAKDPKRRYSTAAELKSDVDDLLDERAPINASGSTTYSDEPYLGETPDTIEQFQKLLATANVAGDGKPGEAGGPGTGGFPRIQDVHLAGGVGGPRTKVRRIHKIALSILACCSALLIGVGVLILANNTESQTAGKSDGADSDGVESDASLKFTKASSPAAALAVARNLRRKDLHSPEAIASMEHANKLLDEQSATTPPSVAVEIKFAMAQLLDELGRVDEAQKVSEQLCEYAKRVNDIELTSAYLHLSDFYLNTKRDPAAALKFAQLGRETSEKAAATRLYHISRTNELCAGAWGHMARAYEFKFRDLSNAELCWRKAKEYSRDLENKLAELQYIRGLASNLYCQDKPEEAIAIMKQWMKVKDKEEAEQHVQLGQVEYAEHKNAAEFSQGFELFGRCLSAMGNPLAAQAYHHQAVLFAHKAQPMTDGERFVSSRLAFEAINFYLCNDVKSGDTAMETAVRVLRGRKDPTEAKYVAAERERALRRLSSGPHPKLGNYVVGGAHYKLK